MKDSKFWQYIDGITLINLDHRTDRLKHSMRQLHEIAPVEKLVRVSGVDGRSLPGFGQKPWFNKRRNDLKWAGRAGCTLSHRKAMEVALALKWETFLILEDDFTCLSNEPALWKSLEQTIFHANNEWDILYLGFTNPTGPTHHINNLAEGRTIYQIQGAKTTHAYLIKSNFAEWVLKKLPEEGNIWSWCSRKRVIDRWYSRNLSLGGNVLCISPSLFVQSDYSSDITSTSDQESNSGDFCWEVPFSMQHQSFYQVRKVYTMISNKFHENLESISGTTKRFTGF